MPDHPCADGLTPACFKAYPAYAQKALAYKLLMMMVPEELSARMPGWIHEAGQEPPPDWPKEQAPPKFLKAKVPRPPRVRSGGITPSPIVKVFAPGPPRRPAPGPSKKQYTTSFPCAGVESVANIGVVWSTVRGTLTGAGHDLITDQRSWNIWASYFFGDYKVMRNLYLFTLFDLPPGAQMVSGYLSLTFDAGAGKKACVQRCPTAVWDDTGDYLSFTGYPAGPVTIVLGENQFPLISTQLAYIKANAGFTCYFMSREYDHDYLNSDPLTGQEYSGRAWTHAAPIVAKRPTLTLVYKA